MAVTESGYEFHRKCLVNLERNLCEQSTYPITEDLVFFRLAEVWDSLPYSYFEQHIASMSTRVTEVDKFRGLSTKY